jgi:hypothetical protein
LADFSDESAVFVFFKQTLPIGPHLTVVQIQRIFEQWGWTCTPLTRPDRRPKIFSAASFEGTIIYKVQIGTALTQIGQDSHQSSILSVFTTRGDCLTGEIKLQIQYVSVSRIHNISL